MEYFKHIDLIKSKESGYKVINNFINLDEINILKNIHYSSEDYFVNREDGKKTSLGYNGAIPEKHPSKWHDKIYDILYNKIKDNIGEFDICETDYPPHFFHTKFPVTVHADTGRNANNIIGKQILVPLSIEGTGKLHTIIFKNRWYGPASRFVEQIISDQEQMNHATILDDNGKFIPFRNLTDFYNIAKLKLGYTLDENGGKFTVNNQLLTKLKSYLKNKERYNDVTNSHIVNRDEFDIEDYSNYLSHIDYNDLIDLKIEFCFEWEIGSALIWDRSLIHSSDNYLKNNVISKLGISIFTIIPKS